MSDTRWSALLFAAAFLARVVAALGSAVFGTDGCHYLLMADWMREGRFHDALMIAYHPMYPLLIAAMRTVWLSTDQAGTFVNLLLGSAAVVPLFLTARSCFGRPVAVITAVLYAFHPAIVEVQSDAMTEGAFMFFMFSSMWLTQRMMEAPSLERGAVLGAAAAAAFLTRPEGLLPIVFSLVWPAIELVRRRQQVAQRLGGLALTVVVIVLLLSPFLLWVRSVRGHWGLSIRPSAIAAEQAVGIREEGSQEGSSEGKGRLLRLYGASLLRLSLYGLLVPFYAVGIVQLRNADRLKSLFYWSFPVGHLGGLLFALREHTFLSERYLMPGMALLGALAGLGMVRLLPGLLQSSSGSRIRPALGALALMLILFAPYTRCLKLRRQECRAYPGAGRWIKSQGGKPRAIIGLEQVAYYAGSRSYYSPTTRDLLLEFLAHRPVDYIVYSDKDVAVRPDYVTMLGSLDVLEPATIFVGPPGSWKVYCHRVKRAP